MKMWQVLIILLSKFLMKHANSGLIKTIVFHAQKSSGEHVKQQSSIL